MRSHFLGIGLCVSLAGCGTVPQLESQNPVDLAKLVDFVQCELHDVVDRHHKRHPWLLQYAAAYTLTIQADEVRSAQLSSTFLSSLLFKWGLDGGISETADRTATMTFKLALADARSYKCNPRALAESHRYGISGQTGMPEWFDRVVASVDPGDIVKHPSDFSHRIEFEVEGSLSPNAHVIRPKVLADATFAAKRKDIHKLDIAFSDASDPGPQKVFVVNFPTSIAAAPTSRAAPARQGNKSGNLLTPDVKRRLDFQLQQLQFNNLKLSR